MSNEPTTLHFRAENFEATATLATNYDTAEHVVSQWVVTAPGSGVSRSVCLRGFEGESLRVDSWSNAQGWLNLTHAKECKLALALAISLLYSVPGVEVYEPPKPQSAADAIRSIGRWEGETGAELDGLFERNRQ